MAESLQETITRLNTETARINWQELERHYARGALMTVDAKLDLITVAAHMVHDDKTAIEAYIEAGKFHVTTDDDARNWSKRDPELWAVVIAPWVLVQEKED